MLFVEYVNFLFKKKPKKPVRKYYTNFSIMIDESWVPLNNLFKLRYRTRLSKLKRKKRKGKKRKENVIIPTAKVQIENQILR